MAVGFWNFVGAGVFGFLINLPIVSYFEVGTALTSNHGHAALFGVFGMLALAVLVFCLRSLADDAAWARAERWIRIGFWGLNAGLALMMAVDLFPAGVLQLWDVLQNGYWHARRLTFLMSGTFHTLEWARSAADTVFLVVGVVPAGRGGRGPAPRLAQARGSRPVTAARPQPPERPATVPWRAVALPAEHGGWGFLVEPVVLGLVLAPSAAGLCLALAALAGFLARHPLRLWLLDRRKHARYPRTALAERFFSGYAVLALALLAAGLRPGASALLAAAGRGRADRARRPRFRRASAAAARPCPRRRERWRSGASATAIALAGGAPAALAWGAWALLALRAVTSVLYVRARIRLDRGLAAGPRAVLAGHAAALAAATGLASAGWAPWLAPVGLPRPPRPRRRGGCLLAPPRPAAGARLPGARLRAADPRPPGGRLPRRPVG